MVSSQSDSSNRKESKNKRRKGIHEKNSRKKRSHKDDTYNSDSRKRRSSSSYGERKRKSKHKEDKRHSKKHRKENHEKRLKKSSKEKHHGKSKVSKSSSSLGKIRNKAPLELLDLEKSYYSYHSKFRVYLYYHMNINFEDLSSKEARTIFKSFCNDFNAGKLEEIFYQPSIPDHILEECKRTQHQWNFRMNNDFEEMKLRKVKKGVQIETERKNTSTCKEIGTTYGPSTNSYDFNPKKKIISNRRFRDHIETVQEELTGIERKPLDGRERMMQKRKEMSNALHSSHRQKEDAVAGIEINDYDLYGSSSKDDFKRALANRRRRFHSKEEKQKKRFEELQKKEDDRKQHMLKMLGLDQLKPGSKIVIQPRPT